MNKYLVTLLLLVVCTSASAEKPQKKPNPSPAASAARRSVSDSRSFMELFTKLEAGTMEAVQKKDNIALDAVLAPEFIARSSEAPEQSISRNTWIKYALNQWEVHSFSQRSMAIRAFASEAVVSYVQRQQALRDGKDNNGEYFIVDLWVVNHGSWQLAARNIAPTGPRLQPN